MRREGRDDDHQSANNQKAKEDGTDLQKSIETTIMTAIVTYLSTYLDEQEIEKQKHHT